MKYAIGIVTYQPELSRLSDNLRAAFASMMVNRVIIYDNHSDNCETIRQLTALDSHCLLMEGDENRGIAYALNALCQKAVDEGCDWILTLDQDSVIPKGLLEEFDHYTDQEDLGIICPGIIDRNMGREYTRQTSGTEYITQCITAGNLVRLKAWQKTGGFSEKLFIDGVDFDFCMKMGEAGFKILRTNNVCLLQEVGHGRKIPLPFHHQMSVLNHSPPRLYYIARNYLYIGRQYHQRWHWAIEVAKRMFIVACFEDNRREKLRAMFLGIRHYRQGKMGRYDLSRI